MQKGQQLPQGRSSVKLISLIVLAIALGTATKAHADRNTVAIESTTTGSATATKAQKCHSSYCRTATRLGTTATNQQLKTYNTKVGARQFKVQVNNTAIEAEFGRLATTALPNPSPWQKDAGIPTCKQAVDKMRMLANCYTGNALSFAVSSNCPELQQLDLRSNGKCELPQYVVDTTIGN